MKILLKSYQFPEAWSELNPRFAIYDKMVNMSLAIFTDLDEERLRAMNSDCSPVMIHELMCRASTTLSYCTTLHCRIGGLLNMVNVELDNLTASKSAQLSQTAKSDASLARALTLDLQLIESKWQVKDLEIMRDYAQHMFWTLKQDAETWRSLYYGATSDRRLTPSVNEPNEFREPRDEVGVGGFVPSAGAGVFGRPAA